MTIQSIPDPRVGYERQVWVLAAWKSLGTGTRQKIYPQLSEVLTRGCRFLGAGWMTGYYFYNS